MGTWDFRQLQQNLDSRNFGNLALIFGEEEFLLSESLKIIKQHVLSEGVTDFNYDQFFAGSDGISNVRDTVEMLPMMSSVRLVILKETEKLKDKDWELLLPVIESTPSSCCLVLVAQKVDKRKKMFKLCEQHGQVIELRKPFENQVPAWVDYMAFNHGLKISREGGRLLCQLVGSNLSDLNSEIFKLKQFVGDHKEVSEEEILKVVSRVRVDSIFDLTDAIGRKDRAQALTYLANLLDHGQSEVGAISLILRHVRILGAMKAALKNGVRGAKLAAEVGVPSFFMTKYLQQCERWQDWQIANTTKILHETDKALKSSPVSSHIWLENFVIKTCSH